MLAFVDEAIAEIEDERLADDDARAAGRLARAAADMRWPRGSSTRSGAASATRAARWRARSRPGLSEARALVHLLLACGLFFVASLPSALREAARRSAIADPVRGRSPRISSASWRWRRCSPTRWRRSCTSRPRASAGAGGFLAARAALFWSLLLAAPVALALALLGVAAEVAAPALLAAARLARLCGAGVLGSGCSRPALPRRRASPRPAGWRRCSPRASPGVAGADRPRWPAAGRDGGWGRGSDVGATRHRQPEAAARGGAAAAGAGVADGAAAARRRCW